MCNLDKNWAHRTHFCKTWDKRRIWRKLAKKNWISNLHALWDYLITVETFVNSHKKTYWLQHQNYELVYSFWITLYNCYSKFISGFYFISKWLHLFSTVNVNYIDFYKIQKTSFLKITNDIIYKKHNRYKCLF